MYQKIGSKFQRKYGKGIIDLSKELKISITTISKWENNGFDIYEKAIEHKELQRRNLNWHKYLKRLWRNICQRCGNPKAKSYAYYGGKGIKNKLTKIQLLILWSRDNGEKLKNPSIDRIDSNGHYEFDNCRFIEMDNNRKNRFKKCKKQTAV